MIKAVIFDLDDTLFSEYEFVLSGFLAVGHWMESHYQIKGFFDIAQRLFAEGKKGKIFDSALEGLGITANPVLIKILLQVYRQHIPKITLYEDAKWAVEYLKKKGHQIGIITDGYLTTQQKKVASLGIELFFNTIVYSDKYGRNNWKPSSVPYLKAMALLGCQGNECVYIGDNPSKDFITAKKLGWQAIHICRIDGQYSSMCVEKSYEADVKISSLYELKQFF